MGGMGLPALWLFLALVVAPSVFLAVGSVWLANKTVHRPGAKEESGSLSPFVTTVGLVYGALLGFTVVVAWEQFSSAEANVTNESSTLATMYRQTVSLPAPEQTTMRELLRKYTTAVQAEWDSQGSDAASDTARARDYRHVPRAWRAATAHRRLQSDQCGGPQPAQRLNVATQHSGIGRKAPNTRLAVGWSAVRWRFPYRADRVHPPR
jgi:hypothetical protein